jgi:Cd2+/Zn2+-exporting ATPase
MKNENEDDTKLETSNEGEEREGRGKRLWITLAAIAFLVAGIILPMIPIGKGLSETLYEVALATATAPVMWEAVQRVKRNPFNAGLLMTVAAVGAAAIGVWEEGAAVLILYNIAENVEDYTADRVRKVAEKTAALLPKRALVKTNSSLEEVPVDKLQIDQVIIVKPGWRIPIDGRVTQGVSSIDQSTITGESIPIEKAPGDEVLSGSLNIQGSLEIKVEKLFSDSTVSRIVKLVTQARERKANIERAVDRFSRRYTPAMMILAASIAIIPTLFLSGSLSVWIYRSLIALIIACPSAFVIATPVTVLMGLTRAMWNGVLVKGGMYLEEMSRTRAVAFDKTGTLTLGRLKVSEIKPFNSFERSDVLRFAALAESRSSHPMGLAIVNEAKERGLGLNEQVDVTEIAGKGVKATLQDGKRVLVGKPSFLKENGIKVSVTSRNEPRGSGTMVAVALDAKLVGMIVACDELRPEARETIDNLRALGIKRVEMLTGDDENTARTTARELGLKEYHANLLPENKVSLANSIREKYGSLVMVGDGVNDAPVLAASNVGVAIGTAGNDIAIEAADIALMGSDLRAVPSTIRLGRRVMSKLKVNIALTLSIKFFMIALGVFGLIPLWFAVIGDDGITLVVIANALPLLRNTQSYNLPAGGTPR